MPSELVDLEIHAVAGVDKAANKRTWLVVKRADEVKTTDAVDKAVWSTEAVNDLPDSSFAYISPGGEKVGGKTEPRSLRHLPYKGADGKPDAAHVRNALARLNQTDISAAAKASAKRKLKSAAKSLGIETTDKADTKKSFVSGVRKWLGTVVKGPNPWMWDEEKPYDFATVWGEWDDQAEYDMWDNMTGALRQSIHSILDADMDEQQENDMIKESVMQFMQCAVMAADEDAAEGDGEDVMAVKAAFAKAMKEMKDAQDMPDMKDGKKVPKKRKDGAQVNKTLGDILKGLGIDVAKNVDAEDKPDTGDVAKRLADAESVIKAERDERAKLEKRLADAEAAQQMVMLAKRAETEIPNLPGTVDEKARILKAVATLGTDEQAKITQILKAANEAIRKAALMEIGKSGPDAGSAEAQIEARVNELVSKSNVSKAKAYAEFMETPEGKALYKQYYQEQRGGAN